MGLQRVRRKGASFTFKVKVFKKGITNKEQKRVPLLEVSYKCRAEPRKKKKNDTDMAGLVVYLTELQEPFTRQLLAVRFAVLSCESLLIFFKEPCISLNQSCHLNITQILHLLLLFYP